MQTNLIVLLLCTATITSTASNGVVTYSIPSFNTTTTVDLLGVTNTAVFSFEPCRHNDDMFCHSEGFVLLEQRVEMWRSGADEKPTLEASFNTSFKVSGSKPIAFVVLLDTVPLLGSLRGNNTNYTTYASSSNLTGVAEVEVGPVMSYNPDFYGDDVGLNVTVTPRASMLTVWIEYDAVVHSLSVYIADGGHTMKPSNSVLDTPINLLMGRHTTGTVYIGFFVGMLRDVTNGILDWNLNLDKFPDESGAIDNKGMAWLLVLLVILGSMAAMSPI